MKTHKLSHERAVVMNLCKEFGYNFMPGYLWYESRKKANRPVFMSKTKPEVNGFNFNASKHEVVEGYIYSNNVR